MPVVPKHAYEQKRLALAQKDPRRLGPRGGTHSPGSTAPQPARRAPTAPCPRAGPGRWPRSAPAAGRSGARARNLGVGGPVRDTVGSGRGAQGTSGSGPLTRRCRSVEVGRKAMDVAAHRHALVGDPKGTEHRRGAAGRRGRSRQGLCGTWGGDGKAGAPSRIPRGFAFPGPSCAGHRASSPFPQLGAPPPARPAFHAVPSALFQPRLEASPCLPADSRFPRQSTSYSTTTGRPRLFLQTKKFPFKK